MKHFFCNWLIIGLLFTSCAYKKESVVPFYAQDNSLIPMYGLSRQTADGTFSFGKSKQFTYEMENNVVVPKDHSLQIDYDIPDDSANYSVAVRIGNETSWLLPLDGAFAGIADGDPAARYFQYMVPVSSTSIKKIQFTTAAKSAQKKNGTFRIHALSIVPKVFGVRQKTEMSMVMVSPFFIRENIQGGIVSTIEPEMQYRHEKSPALILHGIASNTQIQFAKSGTTPVSFLYHSGRAEKQNLLVPYQMLPQAPYPVVVSGNADGILLVAAEAENNEGISADPGFILNYPREKWRVKHYEYFRWDIFPSIIIFDTVNYTVQDSFFKRLAFFAEKKGFRGRLAHDAEIAKLHGWNAHDYNAATLARFFDMVKRQQFPINADEQNLCRILLNAGIIKDSADGNGYDPAGEGAVLSISRESPDYLRRTFIVHEGFHGIFFVDEDFRQFCTQRWNNFSAVPKRFLVSFFDYQQYDIQDQNLVVNEFMAHCLQQSAAAASEYFGKTIAKRIEASDWRKKVLPQKDEESESWPELASAFSAEAAVFSNYVNTRWGLQAGRIWRVSPVL